MNQIAAPEYIGVLLGFCLGLIGSMFSFSVNWLRRCRKARTLLKIEMTTVTKALDCIHPETNIVPLVPLPNLNLVINSDSLSVLGKLGPDVYQLNDSIVRANQATVIVWALEDRQVQDRNIATVSTEIYSTYIENAKELAEKINRALR